MVSFALKEKDEVQNQQKDWVNGQSSPEESQSDDIEESDDNPEENGKDLRDPEEKGIGLWDDSGFFTRGKTPFFAIVLILNTEPFEANKFGAQYVFGSPEVDG